MVNRQFRNAPSNDRTELYITTFVSFLFLRIFLIFILVFLTFSFETCFSVRVGQALFDLKDKKMTKLKCRVIFIFKDDVGKSEYIFCSN